MNPWAVAWTAISIVGLSVVLMNFRAATTDLWLLRHNLKNGRRLLAINLVLQETLRTAFMFGAVAVGLVSLNSEPTRNVALASAFMIGMVLITLASILDARIRSLITARRENDERKGN